MVNTIIALYLNMWLRIHKPAVAKKPPVVLAVHRFSLEDRYHNSYVNNIFKDNILLAIRYATNNTSTITLRPGETFAFHDDVLPQYQGKVDKTGNSHFSSNEGYKSDGYLVGDGVCHLASLLYWVAKDAGLNALAPTRHDFAPVPDVPRQYGVSIYDAAGKNMSNELQNLYISNNKNRTIAFLFNYDGKNLTIKAVN